MRYLSLCLFGLLSVTACEGVPRLAGRVPEPPVQVAREHAKEPPKPALRVYECDEDHCHQVFRVSADVNGGLFYVEGEQERDMTMTFVDANSILFLNPAHEPELKATDSGKMMVTAFVYRHQLRKAGTFHVILRRTVCAGKPCDYLDLSHEARPAPADMAAEFFVSAAKDYYQNAYP